MPAPSRPGPALFASKSGLGKSSLLASLVKHGYAMMSDDVTAVEVDAAGQSRALAALSQPAAVGGCAGRARLEGLPEKAGAGGAGEVSDAGRAGAAQAGLQTVARHTYRKRFRCGSGQQTTRFRTLAAVAKSVPVFRVTRPTHPFLFDALADRIDAHLREELPFAGADAAAGQAGSSAVVDD